MGFTKSLTALFVGAFISTSALAGLPPTSLKGQVGSKKTTFNFQVPESQATQVSGTTSLIETGSQNRLANPGFEGGTTGWTASAGSFTASVSVFSGGLQGGSWDDSASAQTLSGTAISLASGVGVAGRNGAFSCNFRCTSGTCTHLMQAYDGTNVLSSTQITSSSGAFVRTSINFTFPTSGTLTPRLLSQQDDGNVVLDDCYFGAADGLNLMAGSVDTSFKSYSLTIGGTTSAPTKGTITRDEARYARVGDSLLIHYDFEQSAAGSAGSGTYLFPLPSGLTIDTTKQSVGDSNQSQFIVGNAAESDGSTRYLGNVIAYNASNLAIAVMNEGNSINLIGSGSRNLGNTNEKYSFQARVPITGWSAETAFRPDVVAQSWSGYHGSDCLWAVTQTTYAADFPIDASCTFTERKNTNFGTVTSANDGTPGNNLPGIDFTVSAVKTYWVCAMVTYRADATTSSGALEVINGSGTVISDRGGSSGGGSNRLPISLCGLYTASVGSNRLKIRGKVDSNAIDIDTSSTSPTATIEWSLVAVDQSIPAPLLVGSVTSNSSGLERVERAKVNCDASSSIVSQSGTWLSAIGNRSTAACTITIAANIFSAEPTCVLTVEAGTVQATSVDMTSSTAGTIYGASADYDANLICMGPR